MNRGTTTKFLFNDGDYFVALTDRDCVRIGIVGTTCHDVPRDHASFDRIVKAETREEVESLHDELLDASFARLVSA
jgi:hypothetical protein